MVQKGSFLQQDSRLRHDLLIPHQSNREGKACIFRAFGNRSIWETCCRTCWEGLGKIRRSDEFFDHTRQIVIRERLGTLLKYYSCPDA